MKRLFFVSIFTLATFILAAQPDLDLGIKAGLTNSEFSVSRENYTSESIQSYHVGAFGRVGWGRVFLQPEAYFNSRGGDLKEIRESNPVDIPHKFDMNTVDVPLLLGVKLFKSDFINVRAMGGPLFSFVTSKDVNEESRFTVDAFRDQFFGWQYGVGVDLWMITIDARFENSSNSVLQTNDFNARNNTFLISAGIKLF